MLLQYLSMGEDSMHSFHLESVAPLSLTHSLPIHALFLARYPYRNAIHSKSSFYPPTRVVATALPPNPWPSSFSFIFPARLMTCSMFGPRMVSYRTDPSSRVTRTCQRIPISGDSSITYPILDHGNWPWTGTAPSCVSAKSNGALARTNPTRLSRSIPPCKTFPCWPRNSYRRRLASTFPFLPS